MRTETVGKEQLMEHKIDLDHLREALLDYN